MFVCVCVCVCVYIYIYIYCIRSSQTLSEVPRQRNGLIFKGRSSIKKKIRHWTFLTGLSTLEGATITLPLNVGHQSPSDAAPDPT
jgi:hypothetical protein